MNYRGLPELPVGIDQAWRLDHISFVVSSIQAVANRFANSIGATWNREVVHDALQAVKVSFIRGSDPSGTAVELVEPAGAGSPVERFHWAWGINGARRELCSGVFVVLSAARATI